MAKTAKTGAIKGSTDAAETASTSVWSIAGDTSTASASNAFQLTVHKLNGKNYLEWAQSVKLVIDGKGKLGYLTGETKQPAETDPTYKTWRSRKLHGYCVAYQLDGTCYWQAVLIHANHQGGIGGCSGHIFWFGEFISNFFLEDSTLDKQAGRPRPHHILQRDAHSVARTRPDPTFVMTINGIAPKKVSNFWWNVKRVTGCIRFLLALTRI